ncbi:unnamed protein product [Ambrosiozyma monospora]|uniref:Unnamed protein product n=1 Tax=Ambrosiozyma monospora TaxID=43982 RepID=A0ACB5SQQ1_AMBMO|nr:unnamed protein product [Ambrosiozyma monospora]
MEKIEGCTETIVYTPVLDHQIIDDLRVQQIELFLDMTPERLAQLQQNEQQQHSDQHPQPPAGNKDDTRSSTHEDSQSSRITTHDCQASQQVQ